MYEGYWLAGKQHDLGVYRIPDKSEVKFGLWEMGVRVKWYLQDEVDGI